MSGTGIVHLGLGAFFRAHAAVYLQEAMALEGGDWGVVGVSLRSPGVRDALRGNGWRYTLAELTGAGMQTTQIGVLNDVLVAPEDPQSVLEAMANEAVKIVSLTVTEKGYCLGSSTGALDLSHPDIQNDLAQELPRSAPGYITRALQLRRDRGLGAFTVMSLDNLPGNGAQIKAAVLALAHQLDPALADWIAAEARFPATMVDRIVPATTEELIAKLGDPAAVGHEPFRQWVIEDDFVGGARPNWDRVGAQFVRDVTPFEHMKLRMLNGTHSSLAYLGAVAGFRTVSEACAHDGVARFLRHLWQAEIIPSLDPPEAIDLTAYAEALLARYQNPGIQHRLEQIAMDGSQKLPQRILATIAENAEAGRDSPGLVLALAAWVRFLEGKDDAGAPLSVSDPLQDQLQGLIAAHKDRADLVPALLAVQAVFGGAPETLAPQLLKALHILDAKGAREAIEEIQ